MIINKAIKMNSATRICIQVMYPILLSIISLLILRHSTKQEFLIPIGMSSNFNQNSNPIWIAHMSDLHLAPFLPKAIENTNKSFSIIKKFIKPYFLVITGDIVDNYGQESRPRCSNQIESNYQIYQRLIDENGVRQIIFDLLGNHDAVSISKERNLYNNTLIQKYFVNNFTSTIFTKSKSPILLIGFNQASYPTGVGSLGIIPDLTKEKLDLLEVEVHTTMTSIDTVPIFVTHTPSSGFYEQQKSSAGHTMDELLEIGNIKYVLNGHSHPKERDIFHHKRYTEYTAVASKFQNKFAVFSVDNGHPQYSTIYLNNTNPSILTYPAASIYENEIMIRYNGVVRIVSFSSQANHFTATIINLDSQEKQKCELNFVQNLLDEKSDDGNTPRLFQCAFEQSKSKYQGKNVLIIEGDLNEKIEFNVNQPLLVKETQHNKWSPSWLFCSISFAIIYHAIIFACIFIPFSHQIFEKISHSQVLAIILAPFITGYNLKNLNNASKVILFCLIWSPLVLPFGFFFSDNRLGYITMWGYFINGIYTHDVSVLFFGIVFYLTAAVAIEYAFVISLNWSLHYLIDTFIIAGIYSISISIWVYHGTEISYGLLAFLSLPFVFIPMIAFGYVYMILKWRSKIIPQKVENNNDLSNHHLFEMASQDSNEST